MKLKEKEIKIHVNEFLKIRTPYKFNCIRLGTAFKKDLHGLVVGGQDGMIRIYDMTAPIETKNPQVISDLNATRTDPDPTAQMCQLIWIYTGRTHIKMRIYGGKVFKSVGNCSIVTSDESGYVCAVLPSKELWRININNLPCSKGPSQKAVITCLLTADLVTQTGEKCSYILAADDTKHLHFIHQGEVVMTLDTPEVVSAMCCGVFVDADKLDVGPDAGVSKSRTQVALGCINGAIFILHNFNITEEEFGNAQYHITHMLPHPCLNLKIDAILCTGHFNAVHVYHDGKKVGHYETPDWVTSMDISYTTKDNKPEIVVGCLDNSILGLKLLET